MIDVRSALRSRRPSCTSRGLFTLVFLRFKNRASAVARDAHRLPVLTILRAWTQLAHVGSACQTSPRSAHHLRTDPCVVSFASVVSALKRAPRLGCENRLFENSIMSPCILFVVLIDESYIPIPLGFALGKCSAHLPDTTTYDVERIKSVFVGSLDNRQVTPSKIAVFNFLVCRVVPHRLYSFPAAESINLYFYRFFILTFLLKEPPPPRCATHTGVPNRTDALNFEFLLSECPSALPFVSNGGGKFSVVAFSLRICLVNLVGLALFASGLV